MTDAYRPISRSEALLRALQVAYRSRTGHAQPKGLWECGHLGIILIPGMKILKTKNNRQPWLKCLTLSASICLCGNVEGKDEATSQVTPRPLLHNFTGFGTPSDDGSHGLCHVASGVNLVSRPRTLWTHGSARDSGMVPVVMEHIIVLDGFLMSSCITGNSPSFVEDLRSELP